MKNFKVLLVLLIAGLLFTSCADTVTIVELTEKNPHVYGFWGGTWHGVITIFSFIGSLFSDDISVYAISNNGGWYDFGFVAGFGTIVNILKVLVNIRVN